jgi:hypothetical protein
MKPLKILSFLFLAAILFSSCKNYTNEPYNEIKVGETFELYIGENSCCSNCWINKSDIQATQFIGEALVDPGPSDCDGCTAYVAWTFKGIKAGTDTIKIVRTAPPLRCDLYQPDSLYGWPEMFIIKVVE